MNQHVKCDFMNQHVKVFIAKRHNVYLTEYSQFFIGITCSQFEDKGNAWRLQKTSCEHVHASM